MRKKIFLVVVVCLFLSIAYGFALYHFVYCDIIVCGLCTLAKVYLCIFWVGIIVSLIAVCTFVAGFI